MPTDAAHTPKIHTVIRCYQIRRAAWLHPEPETMWTITTSRILRGLFPMFPLTIDGLEGAVKYLVRGVRPHVS